MTIIPFNIEEEPIKFLEYLDNLKANLDPKILEMYKLHKEESKANDALEIELDDSDEIVLENEDKRKMFYTVETLYNNGVSIEDISQITPFSVDEIKEILNQKNRFELKLP